MRQVILSLLLILGFQICQDSPSGFAEAFEATAVTGKSAPPNVLFIAVDDLRPQLACYGQTQMHTPNFDALSKRSVLFERAYCMVPTCGASRASLMTGIRPSPGRFVSYTARADRETPDAITLNTVFKRSGYKTISLGKVFHFVDDNAAGWSETPWRSKLDDYHDAALQESAIAEHRVKYPNRKKVRGMPYESVDAPDDQYRDHETATKAIEYLQRFSQSDQPFFLAVGFNKPHLPFCAPKRYWDLYKTNEIDLPRNDAAPIGAPEGAVHASGELRAYSTIPPSGPVSTETARSLIHGYYACVSFVDAQLGRIIHHLDQSGLSENTIVVLWGDHGWQLGEHGMWNKHSCFETSMHSPLMISAPGFTGGRRCASLTEFIDIYPTLCDLTGIAIPDQVQGVTLRPWLEDPAHEGKSQAIGRFQSGDTIRSDRYRYTEYRGRGGRGPLTGRMLYDHVADPEENTNRSGLLELQAEESRLRQWLTNEKGSDVSSD